MQIPDQTDVFVWDTSGQLNCFSVDGGGQWTGPTKIGRAGSPLTTPLAAGQQAGLPQTDVFFVDEGGQLNVLWVYENRPWGGPVTIGPHGFTVAGAPVATSQQFDLPQTDVFVVDHAGQLNVFFVYEAGAWRGPTKIGAPGLVSPGVPLAAAQHAGEARTDLFVIDNDGQLTVFWVLGAGPWTGPQHIASPGFAPTGAHIAACQRSGVAQTDVFVIDAAGQLNVFAGVTLPFLGDEFSGPTKIGPAGFAVPGGPLAASQQFGLPQTDVFVVDNTGQLNVFWQYESLPWAGPARIGPPGFGLPGAPLAVSQQFGLPQTDVFVVDRTGQLNVFWVFEGRPWGGPAKIGPPRLSPVSGPVAASQQFGILAPPVASPSGGLGSASNYFLANDCALLKDVTVTIAVTEDLVAAPPGANQQPGFAFQLNTSSAVNQADPTDPDWIVWQQYIVGIGGTSIVGAVNNWTAASLGGEQTINAPAVKLATLPAPNTIPTGYTITITLACDAAANITAVTFHVTPGGTPHTITLNSLKLADGKPVTAANLAPIVAFELNLVGPGDLKIAHFTSGAGTFTYSAVDPLEPLPALPTCVADPVTTGESSNSVYGTLPAGFSAAITQAFSVDVTVT